MAGKSGRTIDATVHNVWKKRLLSWEGMLLVLFIVINIFCQCISPNYTVTNVLREMPKYLSEIFLLLPMAYILILGDIDISVGYYVLLWQQPCLQDVVEVRRLLTIPVQRLMLW